MLNIKKIRPLGNNLVVTSEEYSAKDFDTIQTKLSGTLKEYQKVIAVGPHVRNIKEGDLVCINPSRYAVRKYKETSIKNDIEQMNPIVSYRFNILEMDHKKYLMITDQDVNFVVEDYEEETKSKIIVPKKEIIKP